MCTFFSCCSNGRGTLFYFDAAARAELRTNNPKSYEPDSHTSIADYHGYPGVKEDSLNKYEYNPLTKSFRIDQINAKDDSVQVEKTLLALDFKTIVPELIIKPITNPLIIERNQTVTEDEVALLKEWDSVRYSVGGSVGDSVRNSVRNSVWVSVWVSVSDSVGDSIQASVSDSVGDSVRNSVRVSVWVSVRNSVWISVRNSVLGYVGGFFALKQWKVGGKIHNKNPYQCIIALWESGLVPSYDGKCWRLHAGPQAKIVWEGIL